MGSTKQHDAGKLPLFAGIMLSSCSGAEIRARHSKILRGKFHWKACQKRPLFTHSPVDYSVRP